MITPGLGARCARGLLGSGLGGSGLGTRARAYWDSGLGGSTPRSGSGSRSQDVRDPLNQTTGAAPTTASTHRPDARRALGGCPRRRLVARPDAGVRRRTGHDPERPARDDRHAARRCALVVRRRGADAEPRSAGQPRCAVHVRPRPCRHHAALAHQHPDRAAAVRARHARQQRLPGPGRYRHARHAPQGARFFDRRLRRRLPAHQAVRPDTRVRRLRRPDVRDVRHRSPSRCRSAAPTSSCPARVDWIGKQQGRFFGWVHVFDPHSPYKPPDQFCAYTPPSRTTARSRSWTPRSGRSSSA